MALKEIVKGICSITRCKYDVYTKDKTDEMVSDLIKTDLSLRSDIDTNASDIRSVESRITTITSTGTVNETSGICGIDFNYPDGFNKNNTMVLSVVYKFPGLDAGGQAYWWGHFDTSRNFQPDYIVAVTADEGIGVDIGFGTTDVGVGEPIDVRIAIMKI